MESGPRSVGLAGSLLLGLSLWPSASEAQQPAEARAEEPREIGYVASLTGTWLVRDDTVHLGRAVLRSDTILPPADPVPSAELGIILASGRRIAVLCDLPGACRDPLVPADSIRDDSWGERLSRIVRAVAAVMREAPRRYESLISRGASPPEEAVLATESGRVDLEPLVAGRPAGRYVLSFRDLHGDAAGSIGPLELRSGPGRRTTIEDRGLDAGLYEVTVADAPSPYVRGSKTWILLVGPEAFEETRAAFEEARRITRAWGADAPDRETRAFLRAYLDVLAAKGTP